MELDKKSVEIGRIFVEWNRGKIDGGEAMYRVYKLFKKECVAAWNEDPQVKESLKMLKKEEVVEEA